MTISEVKTIRVDDIPLILAMIAEMNIVKTVDDQIQPHGLWQGCSVGTIIAVWLCFIITTQDHRLEPLEEWARKQRPLLEKILGITLRDSDFNDDRLGRVLSMLGQEERYQTIDMMISQGMVQLHDLPTDISRHDSTTSSVYHEITKDNTD